MSKGLKECFGQRKNGGKKSKKSKQAELLFKAFLKEKDSSNFTLLIGFTLRDNQELKNK